MTYERDSIRRAQGYVPGRQRATIEAKLNTNENPYPPCPAVLEVLQRIDGNMLRRYPPPLADGFRAAAAAVHGVAADNLIAVNGGDELLRLAVYTFVEPGAPIGTLEPSYSLYPVLAALHGSPIVAVDLDPDWDIPESTASTWNAAGVRLAFVVDPHAPTGRLTPVEPLRRLAAEFRGVLVIDEAYVDFVDPELDHDAVALVRERDNVLLLRTLSKGYSLAGLRFGYGIGHSELIAPMLTKTRDSYNVDAIAQALATAALEHRTEAARTWVAVRRDREALRRDLAALGLAAPPSQSNFLLTSVSAPGGAATVAARLEQDRVLVRHFAAPRLEDKLRITVGTPAENARLLAALARILGS